MRGKPMSDPSGLPVDAVAGVFRQAGYDGASLSRLSAAAGLKRASLYHHFPGGKEEMGHAALARADARLRRLVIEPLSGPAPGDQRLAAMLAGVRAFYAQEPAGCLINALSMGEGQRLFGPALAQTAAAWRDGIARAYADMGAAPTDAIRRATGLLAEIQGRLILQRLFGEDMLGDLGAEG
ncbi:hypothetical protein CCR85_11600 [Rhodothalassium salexigens]|nr:hypothetical protein [Rhodothalassium salexigens]